MYWHNMRLNALLVLPSIAPRRPIPVHTHWILHRLPPQSHAVQVHVTPPAHHILTGCRQTVHRKVCWHRHRIWIRWCSGLPLDFDGVVFTQLDAVMPKLKRHICRSKVHFDDIVDAVVFGA